MVTVSAIDEERAREAATKKKEDEKDDSNDNKKEEDGEKKDGEGDDDGDQKNKTDHNKPLLPQLRDKFKNAQAYGLVRGSKKLKGRPDTRSEIASSYSLDHLTMLCAVLLPWIG